MAGKEAKEIVLKQQFQNTLQRNGIFVFDMLRATKGSENPIKVVSQWAGIPFEEVAATGVYRDESDMATDPVTAALTTFSEPWRKAGMPIPSLTVKELSRITKIPSVRIAEAIANGYITLNGEYSPQQANMNAPELNNLVGNGTTLVNKLREPDETSKTYQGKLREVRQDGQRWQRRFHLQPKNAEGKTTRRRARARAGEEQLLQAQIVFSDPRANDFRETKREGKKEKQVRKWEKKINPDIATIEETAKAETLGMSVETYRDSLHNANRAFDTFVALGPFYGQDKKGSTPTFRVAAEAIQLPEAYRQQLQQLGRDLFILGNSLRDLPETYKQLLGNGIMFDVPPSFRIDTIVGTDGRLQMNEVQVADGADALMVGEQIVYGLQTLDTSTALYFANTMKNMYPKAGDEPIRIGWTRMVEGNAYVPNEQRMVEFVDKVSNGNVLIELLDDRILDTVNWEGLDGVINSTYVSPEELFSFGLNPDKLIAAGDWTALGNKGVFALLFEPALKTYWTEKLGEDTFQGLQNILIPSRFVTDEEDLRSAQKNGEVAKLAWTDERGLLDRSKGVFGPWSTSMEWRQARALQQSGARIIIQPFIEPKKLTVMVRANGGRDLEEKTGYNRICVKYISDNPRDPKSSINMTATEATIGDNMKPSGRDCCFTAVGFT